MVKGRRVRNVIISDNQLDANNQLKNNYPTTPTIFETETDEMTLDLKSDNQLQQQPQQPTTPHRIICNINNGDNNCTNDNNSNNGDVLLNNKLIDDGNGIIPKVQAVVTKTNLKRRLNNQTNKNNNLIMTNNHKLTEYFPVRRSVRKTKKTVLEEKQRVLELNLRNQIETGLEVRYFEGKGRGVVASKTFNRGDFVVEYSGDLIDMTEARLREEKYSLDQNAGCYMYYFKYNNQQYCIDATAETGRLGRLINHSRNGNLITRTICIDKKPRLVLIAKDLINIGDEVTYDYGDRSKESLRHHPWLAY